MKATTTFCISLLLALGLPYAGAAQERETRTSFRLDAVSLRSSLDSLMRWYPVSVVYLDRDVEGRVVSAACTECTLDQALGRVLAGTSLTWIRTGSHVVLKEREREDSEEAATISGIVSDSITGEKMAGSNVLLLDSLGQSSLAYPRWCPTNSYGFFSLRNVRPGTYTLAVRALGYKVLNIPLIVVSARPIRCDMGMVSEDITLQEVTIEGQRTALASAQGISRGVYIRSTPSDQNQYLLDGARIYNPSHFGGVLSTFNAEALNDVDVVAGGLPPYYGGRVGGIVDLSLRDGGRDRLSGWAGTGTLGSNVSLGGPLDGHTTFLLSGRRGYPDVAVPFLRTDGAPNDMGTSELIAKVTRRFAGGNQVSLNGYFSRDSYTNSVEGSRERLNNDFRWGNGALNLRWTGVATPSLFLQASALYTRYDLTLDQQLASTALAFPALRYLSDFAIEDFSLSAQAEQYYDEMHTVLAGIELVHHRIAGNINGFASHSAPLSLHDFSSVEATVYIQDRWKIHPRVVAEIGARATTFAGNTQTFSAVDPRFALIASLNETTRAYGSFTAINEFIHPYRNSGIFLLYPPLFFYPSTDQVRPSTSFQLTLGAEREVADHAVVASVETYYRATNNLQEFGIDSAFRFTDFNSTILYGTGRAYGVELSVRKKKGAWTGSVTYNLAWARETVAALYGESSFPSPFDRRHELQVASWYAPSERWVFGALCVVASAEPTASAPGQSRASTSPHLGGGGSPPAGTLAVGYVDLNGSKLPGFQRVELDAVYRFLVGGMSCDLSLRMLNGYGLVDPFKWDLQEQGSWRATLQKQKLLPIYPTLGFAVRF